MFQKIWFVNNFYFIFSFDHGKGALPMSSKQPDHEISENAIDDSSDDFSKELPLEAEYYRTSTEHDGFVRPIASPQENEIEDGDDGIDLDDPSTNNQTPDCVYHIDIKLYYESIDQLDIKLDGLTQKSGSKSNLTLNEFVGQAQLELLSNIKGMNFTNELVNDVINYLRQSFVTVYGYEDFCGVSTTVTTYYTKNDTQVDSPAVLEEITKSPLVTENIQRDTVDQKTESPKKEVSDTELFIVETTASSEEDSTEEYTTKVLTRPKLSEVVQKSIDFYKALRNWNYSQQS